MVEEGPHPAVAGQELHDVEGASWYGSICRKCKATLEHGSDFKSFLEGLQEQRVA
jgi:hypothetical protein